MKLCQQTPVLVIACLAMAAPAYAAPLAAAATPLGNPGFWVTSDDYPKEALESGNEGTVRFRLDIDKTGKPIECHVLQSSGNETLDITACNLITLRARFSPALDAKGKPSPGSYSNAVRWIIPKTREPPKAGTLVMTFVLGADGEVSDCRIERAEGGASVVAGRDPCAKQNGLLPYVGPAGQPVTRRVRITHTVTVEDIR